ncbi:MAG: hypothetical protein ACK40G_13905 [Cytophagaceae bacterium]
MAKVNLNHKEALINAGIAIPSAIAGGAIGAAVGRPSLGLGVIALAGGYYLAQHKPRLGHAIILAGAGMMVSHVASGPAPSEVQGIDGLEGFAEDAKARIKEFGKSLGRKAYLDKIPAVSDKLDLSGLGALGNLREPVTYYTETAPEEVSQAEADRIIREVLEKNAMNGPLSDAYNLNGPMSSDYGLKGVLSEAYGLSGTLEAIGVNW